MLHWYTSLSRETVILLSLAIILFTGFLVTRLTGRLRLPNVSGYILAGILIGPGILGLIPAETVQSMDFVSDIALSFIAFGVGRFFRKEALRETGGKVVAITILEALAAGGFYDIVVPPEVFVPVLIHQVVEYLLPFEGIKRR